MILTIFQNIDYRALYLVAGILILFVLFFISYRKQQRRIHSGKELAREMGLNDGGRLEIDLPFHVDHPDKWYRIAAHFDFTVTSKEGWLERLELTRHPFKLSLRDRLGNNIVNSTRQFQDFTGFASTSSKEASLVTVSQSILRYHGDGIPLLEFVPPHTGDYRIVFEIPAEEVIENGRCKYISKFEHFTLSIRGDVLPMKSRSYPHDKLDLRSDRRKGY